MDLFGRTSVMERRRERALSVAAGPTDTTLIASCLAGDDQAWEQLVERYSALVYSIARRHGFRREDAADVHWRTWEMLWEDLPRLRDREQLGPWLITVTARLCWHQIERIRKQATQGFEGEEPLLVPDPDPLPDELIISADMADAVRRAMEQLPQRCQRLLTLLFRDPTAPSYEQIGAELGLARDSVGSLRYRCLQRLRESLGVENDPDG